MFVVQAQIEILHVETADFGGASAADVGGLEQHPVAQPVQWQVLARPPRANRGQDLGDVGDVGGRGWAGQGLGDLGGIDPVHRVGLR
ncbi:hypothetical protein ACWEJ6_54430 [Nonomuraea sp. NPDC004702]